MTPLGSTIKRKTQSMVRDKGKMRNVVITLDAGHQGHGMVSLNLYGVPHTTLTITPAQLYKLLEHRSVGLA